MRVKLIKVKIGYLIAMYGYYKSPLNPLRILTENVHLSIEKEGSTLRYKRTCFNESIDKLLLTKDCGIIINPVEPLKTPKEVTPHLLIEFANSVFIEPKGTNNIYLIFPVDIGVFISGRKNYDLLDVFSLSKQKYTLYGDPRNGVICKYYKSPVYTSIPNDIDPFIEGIMRLKILNTTDNWVEVRMGIFDAHAMKIYFNEKLVSTRVNMKILTEKTAETEFIDSGIKKGMKKSLEVFTWTKIPVPNKKYLMEEGF